MRNSQPNQATITTTARMSHPRAIHDRPAVTHPTLSGKAPPLDFEVDQKSPKGDPDHLDSGT
jgi:hypothetical protein